MPNYKIPFSFIWYWFFFLNIKYFAFIVKKNEKNTYFLMNFQPKNLNFQMALDSNHTQLSSVFIFMLILGLISKYNLYTSLTLVLWQSPFGRVEGQAIKLYTNYVEPILVCYLDNNLGCLYVGQVVLSHSLAISTNIVGETLEQALLEPLPPDGRAFHSTMLIDGWAIPIIW